MHTRAVKRLTLYFALTLPFLLGSFFVYALPTANFTANSFSGCSPLVVSFTNLSSGNSPTYFWDFGNGNTSTLTSPSASYINPGTYQVKLTVTDPSGSQSITKNITVFANPTAGFSASKLGGCVGDQICFTDQSVKGSGNINFWSWDFGDGKSSGSQHPCNTYTFADTFKVTLVVKDVNGCQSTMIKPKYIVITPAPAPGFSTDKTSGCKPPVTINFTDATTPANLSFSYAWDFGDGGNSTQKNPQHTYNATGKYTVTLTTSLSNGCTRSVIKPNLITVYNPVADFTADDTSGCQPLSVNFSNKSTSVDPTTMTYLWTLSDGRNVSVKNPSFTFNNPGLYSVTLRVATPGGCADTLRKTAYIYVADRPRGRFTLDKNLFCTPPAQVKFSSVLTNTTNVKWVFSDGGTSTETDPVKTFLNYGSFDVKLVVESAEGCKDSMTVKNAVRVIKPGFVLSANPVSGCAPLYDSIFAIDTGLMKHSSWKWLINGVIQPETGGSMIRVFDEGDWLITCIGRTSEGCMDTQRVTINVDAKVPKLTIGVVDSTVCFNGPDVEFIIGNTDSLPPGATWTILYGDKLGSKNKKHKYFQGPGDYHPKVVAQNGFCSVETELDATIHILGPRADFYATQFMCKDREVTYTNTTSPSPSPQFKWYLGNGDSADTEDVENYAYDSSGNYVVYLYVWDTVTGCRDSMSDTIFVPRPPELGFILKNTAGCAPLKVTCIDTSIFIDRTVRTRTWSWPPSRAVVSVDQDTEIVVTKLGYSKINLLLTDNYGCVHRISKDSAVHVYDGVADFKMTPPNGCKPLYVTITDKSKTSNPVVSRKWDWGTGAQLVTTDSIVYHTYDTVAPMQLDGFRIVYTITDSAGCVFRDTDIVTPQWPIPEFNYVSYKKCNTDSIRLTVAQNFSRYGIGPFQYTWILGDNQISNLPTTVKVYHSVKGDKPISLVKRDGLGCIDTLTKMIPVNSMKPDAGFYADPQRIDCPGPPVHFYDTSVAGNAPIISWSWTFGDGTKSDVQHPLKTYLLPGQYPVSLIIKDSLNCLDTVYNPGYILIAGPTATFQFSPQKGCTPLDVSFSLNSKNTVKYEWDLGDGWTDTNAVFVHRYDRANQRGKSYRPNLTITDSTGCKRGITTPDSIVVYPLPKPDFNTNLNLICQHTDLVFNNTTTHDIPIKLFRWDFGDGEILTFANSSITSFIRTYDSIGVHSVKLTATDTLNCVDSITKLKLVTVINDTTPPQKPVLYRTTVVDNTHTLLEFLPAAENDLAYYTVHHNYVGSVPTSFKDLFAKTDTIFSQSAVNTLIETYSYAVSATDVCKNVSDLSDKHTTINITAMPVTNAILATWTPYLGWDSVSHYEVFRKGADETDYTHIGSVAGNQQAYTDSSTLCFKTYYYRVKAVQKGGLAQISWSDTSGATPTFKSTIPATENIRATVVNDKYVLLQWNRRQHALPFKTVIYRSKDNEAPEFFREITTADTALTDLDVEVDAHSYTYTTYLLDNCGGLSNPSNIAKTIVLNVDLKASDIINYDPFLTWSPYGAWQPGVDHYEVSFLHESEGRFISIGTADPIKALEFSHRQVNLPQREYCYKITAYKKGDPKIFSESNINCIVTAPRLFAPNVFTINDDGLNETFKLGGVFIDTYHIDIYNRYGELIFSSDSIEKSWDGTVDGKPCAADVYVYLAEAKGIVGQRMTLKGNVTLLR